jgi:hypothetical protein
MLPERLRTGRRVGRTIYDGDELVGVMDTRELASAVVAAFNRPSVSLSQIDWLERHLSNIAAMTTEGRAVMATLDALRVELSKEDDGGR